jgi:hypothetical protein
MINNIAPLVSMIWDIKEKGDRLRKKLLSIDQRVS